MFKGNTYKYISIPEMNKHLKYAYKYYAIKFDKPPESLQKLTAYIEDGMVYFKLTYVKSGKRQTYITRKDGEEHPQVISGMEAYRILKHYYDVPEISDRYKGSKAEGGISAAPLLYYNPKYEGKWLNAYQYDMNSAYSWGMLQPMPDTSKPMRMGTIRRGEIGFYEEETSMGRSLAPKFEGFSLYIFPLMESPFGKFVENWYQKKTSGNSEEKIKAKQVLNYAVGYLQRHNPFLRAAIIGYCNKYIKSLIDENTLFCNTDSITTLKPLNLNLGKNVGEWKLENRGEVAYVGYNYQWKNVSVSYRGIPKRWFKNDFDITKDAPPVGGNLVEFDSSLGVLYEISNI